jgi:putative ABC transport system permease protein
VLSRARSVIKALFRRGAFEDAMADEVRFHLDAHIEDLMRSGLPRDEAVRQAHVDFGGSEGVKEECRQARGLRHVDELRQDLRYAVRTMARSPGFSAVVVSSLALGIAANTTIFSFVNDLLFRPAPVAEPGELWQVWRQQLHGASSFERYQGLSYPGYAHFRDRTRSFAALAAFDPETPFVSWNRDGIGQSIQAQFVSGDFFDVCRIGMARGRAFGRQEDRHPGADPVAVISYAFWRSNLGGDRQAVGKTLTINGVGVTVIGIAPPEFTGLLAGLAPDLWVPFMMAPTILHDAEWHTRTGAFSLFGVGRLRRGVTAAQAEAELTAMMRRLEEIDAHNRGFAAAVFPTTMVPLPFRGFVRAFTAVLMGAVFMVLLIACVNAANLMLARAVSRRREMAVRASIGASRGRLIRQLLTESMLLAFLAGSVGLLLAHWFVAGLLRLTPPTLPLRPDVHLDGRVLAFTGLAALLTGLVFGLAPAWQGTKVSLISAFKKDSSTTSVRQSHFANVLIVGQLAVCFVLLVAGALCLRSLLNAQSVQIGFNVENRVTAEVNLKDYGYSSEEVERFNAAFVQRVAAVPGIEAVSVADYLPLDARFLGITFNAESHEPPPGDDGFTVQTFDVGPGYFQTMGTILLKGRAFTPSDRKGAPQVAIVNQAMADQLWPDQDAVGRRLFEGKPGEGDTYEIVGIVETGKYRTLGENATPVVFRCRLQHPGPRSTFVADVSGDSQAALAALRHVQHEIDPRLAFSRLGTLEEHLSLALFPARTTGLLFSLFGAVALLLAVSGLFGVIAYSVSRRTREFGIRMALGATRRTVLRIVLQQGLKLAGLGIGIGLVAALAATRLLRSLLYGISPMDPATFVAVPILLTAVSLLACLLPSLRAARVDPVEALRYE